MYLRLLHIKSSVAACVQEWDWFAKKERIGAEMDLCKTSEAELIALWQTIHFEF